MPVPTLISELSQTAGSNSPAGSESPTTADDYFRTYASFIAQLRDGKGFTDEVDVASAATCDIGAVNSLIVRITGTTGITSLGTTYNGPRFVRFADALTLTHNATTLILPGGANITTATDDALIAVPSGSTPNGWRVIAYQKAADSPVTLPLATTLGGSGSNYADVAALFAGIKQAASDTATGVVELATDAEAQAGTDTTRAVTPDNLGATVLGIGQSWQVVTGSRAIATDYTNTTGRPIQVLVTVSGANTGGQCAAALLIDGVTISSVTTSASNGTTWGPITQVLGAVVPAGAVYRVNSTALSNTLNLWSELR